MVMWKLVYTKQSQKDAKKIAASNLKGKVAELLSVIQINPFQNPPPYESWLVTSQVHIHAELMSNIVLFMR